MRWSDSRRRASRTAANASKRRSSSSSPFASRSRNSTVFARSSSSESSLEVGLERRDVGACSARRFMRRPSPKRRAFSKDPKAGIRNRVPARYERGRLDLPEVAVEPRRPGRRSRVPPALRPRSNAGAASNDGLPSTWSARPSRVTTSSSSLARLAARLEDDDRRGADRPGRRRPAARPRRGTVASSAARTASASGRTASSARPPSTSSVSSASATNSAVSPSSPGARAGDDGVPAPRPRDAMDAGLAARLAVPAGRLRGEPGRTRLVARRAACIATAEERHLLVVVVGAAAAASSRSTSHRDAVRDAVARRSAVRGSASPAARASRRAGRSTPSCRARPRARAASDPS